MALPPGVAVATVTFGSPASSFFGGGVATSVVVTPTHSLIHTATGAPLIAFVENASADQGMPGSITLPLTDQDGFQNSAGAPFKNWAYNLKGTWAYNGQSVSFEKNFQLVAGQVTVDLDMIPGGDISLPVSAPIPVVTSFLGKTGAITSADVPSGGTPADGSISTAKLATDAVTSDKIAGGAVGNPELDTEAVTVSKIGPNAVTGVKIADGAVSTSKLATALQTTIAAKVDKTVADVSYSKTAAPFFARRDETIPSLYSYFGNKANAFSAAPPLDSGQVATFSGTAPSIVGGTLAPIGSGVRASYYRSPDMGAPVTRCGGRFRLLPGSGSRTAGGTACIAILNGLIDPANITIDMAAHFFTTSTAWAYTVWLHGSGQTVLLQGTYAKPLLTDYYTEYEMQVWLNGTTATFDLPDGSRRTVSDSRISSYAGNFAFWEGYLPGGDTDDIAAFTHMWADTGVNRIPAQIPNKTVLDQSYAALLNLAKNVDTIISGTVTRDANQAVTSAQVLWPDGTAGTFTATTLSSAFPGAVDAYTVTYGSPATKTFTQPAITRNASGAATAVPAMTVS